MLSRIMATSPPTCVAWRAETWGRVRCAVCQGRDSLRFEQRLCQPRGVRPLLFRGVHLDLLLDLHRRRQWRRVKLAHGMRLQDVHVQHGEPVSRIRQIDTWGSGFRLSQSGV